MLISGALVSTGWATTFARSSLSFAFFKSYPNPKASVKRHPVQNKAAATSHHCGLRLQGAQPTRARTRINRGAFNTKNVPQGPAVTWGPDSPPTSSQRSRGAHREGSPLPRRGSGSTGRVVLKLQRDCADSRSQAFHRDRRLLTRCWFSCRWRRRRAVSWARLPGIPRELSPDPRLPCAPLELLVSLM